MGGGGTPTPPPPPPPPPTIDTASVQAAADEARRQRLMMGRASQILTNPQEQVLAGPKRRMKLFGGYDEGSQLA